MIQKIHLIRSACLIATALTVAAGALWHFFGADIQGAAVPFRLPDGRMDYAGFFKKKLPPLDKLAQQNFLYAWVAKQPSSELEEIFRQTALIPPPLRLTVREPLVLKWADTDPQQAWRFLRTEPPIDLSTATTFIEAWGQADVESAWKTLETDAGPGILPDILPRTLTRVYGYAHPKEAAERSLNSPKSELRDAINSAMDVWGDTDPRAAMEFGLKNRKIKQMRSMFVNWILRDIDTACAGLEEMPAKDRDTLVDYLFEQEYFVCGDPETALAFADRFPASTPDARIKRLRPLFEKLARVRTDEIFRRLAAIDNAPVRQELTGFTINALARVDATQAFARFMATLATFGEEHRESLLKQCMPRLAENAPLQVIAFLQEYPEPRDYSRGWLNNALGGLEPREYEEAFRLISAPSMEKSLSKIYNSDFFINFYNEHPARMKQWLTGMRNKDAAGHISWLLVDSALEKNPRTAIALLDEFSGVCRIPENQVPTFKANVEDAQYVLEWAQKNLSGQKQSNWTEAIISCVARQDAALAFKLVEAMPDGQTKDSSFVSAVKEASKESPLETITWLGQLPPGDEIAQAVHSVFEEWSRVDEVSALQSLKRPEIFELLISGKGENAHLNLPWRFQDSQALLQLSGELPPEYGALLIKRSCWIMAQTENNPAGAIQLAENHLGEAAKNTILSIHQQWSTQDPLAAMQWLCSQESFPSDSHSTNYLYSENMSNWVKIDPEHASTWLNSQPAGEVKDQLIQGLVNTEKEYDTAAAFEWALQISSAPQRASMVNSVISTWKKFDPQAAQAAQAHWEQTQQQSATGDGAQ